MTILEEYGNDWFAQAENHPLEPLKLFPDHVPTHCSNFIVAKLAPGQESRNFSGAEFRSDDTEREIKGAGSYQT